MVMASKNQKLAQRLFTALALILFTASYSWAILVNSMANSGAGTLRQAILDANANAGADTVTFDPVVFPAGSPATINLTSALPILTGRYDRRDRRGRKTQRNGVAHRQYRASDTGEQHHHSRTGHRAHAQ